MAKRILAATTGFVGAALLGTSAMASVVYNNDFSSNSTGFTGGTIVAAPSGQKFLSFGGAGGSANLLVTGLAAHTNVTLSFSLYVIGSMDGAVNPTTGIPGGGNGDYFIVTYAGSSGGTAFNQAFANYGGGETQTYPVAGSAPGTGAATVNALGYTGFPSTSPGGVNIQDAEYNFTLAPITDSFGAFSFGFTDNSNEGVGNEFYGIDNVVVSINDVPTPGAVPEPASWATMLLGFAGIGTALRRRSTAALAA